MIRKPYTWAMSRFIRKVKTASGATAVQIVCKQGRAVASIDHIGSAHNGTELEFLVALAKKRMQAGQMALDLFAGEASEIFMERAYSELLWDVLQDQYHQLGFGALADSVFEQLVLARIIEPASKLDTIRVLGDLGLDAPSNAAIHRCLRRMADKDYRSAVSACCFDHASASSLTLLLYDVTTLYFEIQKEDGYRRPGLSKERRLEPQITVGLLVGRDGFPLEVMSFEGNRAEVKTITEVLDAFKDRHRLDGITVTADAAMLSSSNIKALEERGYHYIIGSRLAKTPYEVSEYMAAPGAVLKDGQIFESSIALNTGKGTGRAKRRVIYQYRAKRAQLDLRNIDKTLLKAQSMVDGTAAFKRNRFLKVSGSKREINHELVAEARRKAGIKGYVTDLRMPASEVIDAYHQLFQVERSFRMSKSDLKARPVFHHKRDSIEAHLTVVFTALAIARRIQAATGLSIKRFVQKLSAVRTGVVSVNGSSHKVPPRIPAEIAEILEHLGSR
ncbi:MAG: IS1634 family transposase [Coriobacteriia bacterium]